MYLLINTINSVVQSSECKWVSFYSKWWARSASDCCETISINANIYHLLMWTRIWFNTTREHTEPGNRFNKWTNEKCHNCIYLTSGYGRNKSSIILCTLRQILHNILYLDVDVHIHIMIGKQIMNIKLQLIFCHIECFRIKLCIVEHNLNATPVNLHIFRAGTHFFHRIFLPLNRQQNVQQQQLQIGFFFN